ncbi:MAG: methyltransferase domain-containing protein [Synergistaceae bacterium]|jgi:tRNA1(Val) A37 N6-methylase TrmN6|nr:methyltransferase domain-containing protein [Synergistaceae bacterium]
MTTRDEILYGRLKLWQPDPGPRVNMDTVLLAAYVRLRSRGESSFVELGSATGAVSLMLALRFPKKFHVTGLEIQPDLVELAQRNRVENGLEDRVSFRCMDLREHRSIPAGSFDGLVVNPPYEEEGRGRKSPVEGLTIARQGSCCSLRDVVEAASWLLKYRGKFFAVFSSERSAEFLTRLTEAGIVPKRLRFIHSRSGKRAGLLLVEGMKKGGTGLVVEPPLFVYGENGEYTEDLLRAYTPEGLPCL